jgi:hypothetical protein
VLLVASCDGVFGIQHITTAPDANHSYANVVLADHPIAYFPLDDDVMATTTTDVVGGLVGQVKGLAASGAEPPFAAANHAYAFDGNNGSVEVGDVLAFSGNAPFSVEAWVLNGHDTSFNYAIVSKWRQPSSIPPSGWLLYYQEGDDLIPTFRFQREDANGLGFSANATPSEAGPSWRHVVGTYDGANSTMYLDGVYGSTHTSTEALEHLAVPLEIGAQNGNPHDGPMLGTIDEVAIYDYALTDVQIQRHFAARETL